MMLVRLAPVCICFFLCFLLARILAGRNRTIQDWRLNWTFATLVTGAFLVLIAEISGAFNSLDGVTVALAWIGLDATLISVIGWRFRTEILELASTSARAAELFLTNRKYVAEFIGPNRAVRWLYGAGFGFALFLGIISLQAPAFIWDCKTYHVPRVLNWVQDKNLSPFPTSDIRRVAYAPGAEIDSTVLDVLAGSDRPINLPSWFSAVTAAILASFATELLIKLFCERTGREWPREKVALAGAFAFILVLTIPEGLFQAISTENDMVAAMWNLSLACMVVLYLRQPANLFYAVGIGLSVALGICTKVTTFISATPFLVGVFGLLAWRRLGTPALKLAGVLVVAVAIINAPWWMRNDRVFGHFLGPDSVHAANANPSFNPARAAANIFRNLCLYTATPSPLVTKALNSALRTLVSWTGQPLDDPTSIVPYNDPGGFSLHFAFSGPAVIGNGDGFGNVQAWLMLIAILIICALPLRNALGFYAVCVGVGFCLSCVYLRWHVWIFRLHVTYFVLAMPVVAIAFAAMARRGFVLILGGLCLVNAVLILAFNTQYPVFAPFLKLTREEHQFGSNLHLHPAYVALAEDIIARGCTNVLLKCETYNFDYGLWVCLQNRGYRGTIQEFMVQNETGGLRPWKINPGTTAVFIGSSPSPEMVNIGGPTRPLLQIAYGAGNSAVIALFPSAKPGDWVRFLGPDNHADLPFALPGASGIGPDKPAEIHFVCTPVGRDGASLTNNILRLILGNQAGNFDLGSGGVDASIRVVQPSFAIRAALLKPVSQEEQPACISDPHISWTWAAKQPAAAKAGK
jgi:hypothetical protein